MIINCTQHKSTPAQIAAGVVDLGGAAHVELCGLLTLGEGDIALLADASPVVQREYLEGRAEAIVRYAVVPKIHQAIRCLMAEEAGDPADLFLEGAATGTIDHGITAMIGGAPYLMAPLERALARYGVAAMYALSVRRSVEVLGPDGTVTKTQQFHHAGFVAGCGL